MPRKPKYEVFRDNHLCKITIEEDEQMLGIYYVIVDDDPEHVLSSAEPKYEWAVLTAEEIYAELEMENGQFGAGA